MHYQNLNPSLHSLPYLLIWDYHVCSIRSETGNPFPEDVRPGGKLWSKAVHFLTGFDPVQVRYAGNEWRELVELVGQSALAVSKARPALLDQCVSLLTEIEAIFGNSTDSRSYISSGLIMFSFHFNSSLICQALFTRASV